MIHEDEYGYLAVLDRIMGMGEDRPSRAGVTRGMFGIQMRFDLQWGFPLLTTKRVHMKSIVHELLWFLKGDTNIGYLNQNGVTIWDEWADERGDLGPIYGYQWRSWPGGDAGYVDQIQQLIRGLRQDPMGRRHIVSAWNPADIPQMALPPCHCLFQFYVHRKTNRLSCQLYQRSADMFLGVPFNIASYALLTHMVAQQCGMGVGEFIWTGGDCHIYHNHFDQVWLQIGRTVGDFPHLHLTKAPSIFSYRYEDVQIVGYDPHPAIPAPVAI